MNKVMNVKISAPNYRASQGIINIVNGKSDDNITDKDGNMRGDRLGLGELSLERYPRDLILGVQLYEDEIGSFEDMEKLIEALKFAKGNNCKISIAGNYDEFKAYKDSMKKYVDILQELEDKIADAGLDNL